MYKDLWDELQDTEDTLRRQAADAESMAEQKRQQATILEGEAAGLLRAADMLRNIERPQ
jgi:hypothetical protein